MTTTAATDAELVAVAQQGDLDAFGTLYERHFDSVHDYVSRLIRDPLLAADATRDTFIRATRQLGGLDDPARFRVWLYTIARTQAIDQIEQKKLPIGSDGDVPDEQNGELEIVVDLDSIHDRREAVRVADVADEVWMAATSLDEPTYTVLDLSSRHDLTSSELADVTGPDTGNDPFTVTRLMDRACNRITTYLVMRRGTKACEGLRAIVGYRTSPPDLVLREEVERHVNACKICSATKRRLASPPQVMAALATIAAPAIVYNTTWGTITAGWNRKAPRSRLGHGTGRAAVFGTIYALILTLGVAGAVQLNDSQPELGDVGSLAGNEPTLGEGVAEPAVLIGPSSTTSTTAFSITTTVANGTTVSTPTAVPSTTTIPGTTTTALQTTTTAAIPPPPPPPTSTTTTTLAPNGAPMVTIIAPTDGEHFPSAQPLAITLQATVSDDFDSGLVAEWFEGATPVGSGNVITFTFSSGCPDAVPHTVTASATDSGGLIGSDTVTFTVGCRPTP
jgi:RNA polymerase sigma factor (sigma-70 family)